MCGIVGMITTDTDSQWHPIESFFKQALFADTLRGPHSTGIFATNQWDTEVTTFKKAMAAPDFLQLKTTDDIITPFNWTWNVLVGHNRYATKGGISHKTAHPFTYDHITLVHNGTLNNHKGLIGGQGMDSDSEAIAKSFSLKDPIKTINDLDGSFALVWYDTTKGTLNFIRNKERPLSYAKVKKFNTILLASESEMLKWIAKRNGIELEAIVTPNPGELFSFTPDYQDDTWATNPEVTKVAIKKSIPWHEINGYYSGNFKSNSSLTPSNTFPLSESEKALKDILGLNYGDEIVIENGSFEKYMGMSSKGKIVGKLQGISAKAPYIVHLSGIDERDYEDYYSNEDILTEIQYAYMQTNSSTGEKNLVVCADSKQFWILDNTESSQGTSEDVKETISQDTNDITTLVRGPRGMITEEEFDRLTSKGCSYCQGNIYPEEADKVGWHESGSPVCPDCIESHDLKEMVLNS